MRVVFGLLHPSSECFHLVIEGRVESTNDLQIDRLETVQSGVLEYPFSSDVHRENLAVGIEESFGLDDYDF